MPIFTTPAGALASIPRVALAARAWMTLGRLQRRIGKPAPETCERDRREWIASNAPGRSFADVGGLFHYHGEIALLAEQAGASPVTLFDAGDVNLTEFPKKAAARNSSVRFVQGDLEDPVSVREIGPHDIVWCTGVIYHSPNPVVQLLHLRQITRELLYLGSHTIPEVPGIEQACVYYPYVSDASRAAYAQAIYRSEEMVGIGVPFDERPMFGHANFWWGITPSALRAMLRTARFEVVEERRTRESPFGTELVARPIDSPPLLPPTSYYRERGERRARGEEQLPFDDYYETTPSSERSRSPAE
jgi:2-polyprenyl-3-methyl-5-hydroxy-6-metoxy-1,4-benzoquinol methylase